MVEPPDELPPPSMAMPSTTDSAAMDLDDLARSRVSTRRRAAQVGAVLLAVVVVVGLLLHNVWPAPHGRASVLPRPSATPTPQPPTVVIESNVNFGTMTVNGHMLEGAPPLVTHDFRTGTNVVTLNAPPFRLKTCHFLLPSDQPPSEIGCSSSGSGASLVTVNGVSVAADRLLTVTLGTLDLPSALVARAAAMSVQVVAAVHLQTMVPAGQYYATGFDAQGHITSQQATVPLQAEVLFGSVDPQAARSPADCLTSPFCAVPIDPNAVLSRTQHLWSLGLALAVRWRFTPPAGQPTLSPALPLGMPIQIFLAYDGASGWSVVPNPQAQPLTDVLTGQVCFSAALTPVASLFLQGVQSVKVLHTVGIEGCELQVTPSSGAALGTMVWRFGVLLAVDQSAHMLAPWLPTAPQAEVAAVEG